MELMDYVGKEVRERLTMRTGVCIGVSHWLYGCHHVRVVFSPGPGEMTLSDGLSHADSLPVGYLDVVGERLDASDFSFDEELEEKLMGKEVRDKVTGFEGICSGLMYDLYSDVGASLETGNQTKADVLAAIMTPQEMVDAVTNNDKIDVTLEVKVKDAASVGSEVAGTVQEKLAAGEQVYYFDADLYLSRNGASPAKIKHGKKTYKVTAISSYAFIGNDNLRMVIVGKNVKRITPDAFAGCDKLENLKLATTKLTKQGVRNSLRGSKVNTISLLKKAQSKLASYKKIFTKKNSGAAKKLSVKKSKYR